MRVEKDRVVILEYTMTDQQENVLETIGPENPIAILHGRGQIFPLIEMALKGKAAGEGLAITLSPQQAFGQRDESLVKVVPRNEVHVQGDLKTGMRLKMGDSIVVVSAFDDKSVRVDGNHPGAGKSLHYEIHVQNVRKATEEELAHGHAHGLGGHAH